MLKCYWISYRPWILLWVKIHKRRMLRMNRCEIVIDVDDNPNTLLTNDGNRFRDESMCDSLQNDYVSVGRYAYVDELIIFDHATERPRTWIHDLNIVAHLSELLGRPDESKVATSCEVCRVDIDLHFSTPPVFPPWT